MLLLLAIQGPTTLHTRYEATYTLRALNDATYTLGASSLCARARSLVLVCSFDVSSSLRCMLLVALLVADLVCLRPRMPKTSYAICLVCHMPKKDLVCHMPKTSYAKTSYAVCLRPRMPYAQDLVWRMPKTWYACSACYAPPSVPRCTLSCVSHPRCICVPSTYC